MKKKLFTLLVCAFAAIGANASIEFNGTTCTITNLTDDDYNSSMDFSNVETLVISGTISGNYWNNNIKTHFSSLKVLNLSSMDSGDFYRYAQDIKDNFSGITTIFFPTSSSVTSIPYQICNSFTNLATVSIPDNITTIESGAFQHCTSLRTLTLPSNLQEIKYQAFEGSGLTQISIPGTVKFIRTEAFINCASLTKVEFQEHLGQNGKSDVEMTIEEKAFRQASNIVDVYIQSVGNLTCANSAFDYATTYGHGDPTATTATLHFPESEATKYVNPDLDNPLTMPIIASPSLFHIWLMKHFANAQSAGNGWFEFKSNGSGDGDPIPNPDPTKRPKFLMTYSDEELDHLVPQGTKAYIVNGIEQDGENYKVSLLSIPAIPKGTGVILYGAPNSRTSNGGYALSMDVCVITGSFPYRRDHWDELGSDTQHKNYLMPTGNTENATYLNPYEDIDGVRYRNFVMGRINNTDIVKVDGKVMNSNYEGFFRVKPGYAKKRKAYLHLSNDEYGDSQGLEAIVVGDTEQYGETGYANYQMEVDRTKETLTMMTPADSGLWQTGSDANPNMDWTDDSNWGDRTQNSGVLTAKLMFFGEPESAIIENVDGTATAIVPASMIEGTDKGVYFTPQGIQVSNPTKGLYIKNGKKVIVK